MAARPSPQMRIELSATGRDGWTPLRLPYDPDTPFSVVRYDFLKHIGFEPDMLNEVRSEGEIKDRLLAPAFFRYRGRVTESRVVFANLEDRCVWGWHAVYFLGWEINPANGHLRRPARFLKSTPYDLDSVLRARP